MTYDIQDRPLVTQINDAIRDNPLAAGLIGAGLAWMIFGTTGIGRAASTALDTARSAGTGLGTAAKIATAGIGNAAQSVAAGVGASTQRATALVRDAATEVASASAGIASSAASIVPDLLPSDTETASGQGANDTQAQKAGTQGPLVAGGDVLRTLQSSLATGFERQPLLLGALGLAIGAGLASTFAVTRPEREWMGEAGEAARHSLQDMAAQTRLRAEQVAAEMRQEAARQGLTTTAAKETAVAVAEKIKAVAQAATTESAGAKGDLPSAAP